MGDENPIHTLGVYSKPSHEGYMNTIELPVGNNVVPLRSDTIQLVQNGCSFHGLRSEDPNQHLKDFLKLVDSLDLDAGSITTWEDLTTRFLAQFFLQGRTAKLRNDILMFQQHHGESLFEAWTLLEDLTLYDNESWNDPRDFAKPIKAIALPQDVLSTSDHHLIELENQVQRLMEAHLAPTQPTQVKKITTSCEIYNGPHNTQYCMEDPKQAFVEYASSRTDEAGGGDGDVMFIEIVLEDDNSRKEEPKAGEQEVEYFNVFPTRSELAYHKYLMCGLIPLIFLRNPNIMEGCPLNLKIPCNIGHVHVEKAYIDLNSPLNIMTQMMYNWIMRRKPNPRENANGGVSNFTGRINGMHVFVGNFTYIMDFMIIEDISSIIDLRLSQVVLGKPFVEISNMTHDPPEGVVRFTNRNNEVSYNIPHKIEQYDSLSNLEKEHTKSVYLRNEEDKRRGVEYVMSKILGFYKECLELGPEYLTGMDDKGEVT
ncbi:MAK10-like protein [Tanacetum coccineum]